MEAFCQHWSIKDPVASKRRGVPEFVLVLFLIHDGLDVTSLPFDSLGAKKRY